jgi:hypothetical protein
MNRTILTIAIALLIPAALLADVKVKVSASISTPDIVFVDDPWFEERECGDENARMSLEYQWTINHGVRVLHYREVRFTPFNSGWVFGPWMVHHGRYIAQKRHHHNHWERTFSHYDNNHNPQYTYFYRDDRYRGRSPVVTHRYEYYNYDNNTHRPHEKSYNRYEKKSYQHEPAHRNNTVVERHTYTERTTPVYKRSEVRNNNNAPIIKVTERERVR